MPDLDRLLALTANIVSAHVAHNDVALEALPKLIQDVFRSLSTAPSATLPVKLVAAVPIERSVRPDSIRCLECGKSFMMLKRHLMVDHRLTPQAYREKWGLPRSYPIVAADYARHRSAIAKEVGLGRSPQKRLTG